LSYSNSYSYKSDYSLENGGLKQLIKKQTRILAKLLLASFLSLYIAEIYADQSCRLPRHFTPWDYDSTAAIDKGKDWRSTQKTDYWMLSLSWSKAFCDRFENDGLPKQLYHQCLHNKFGLVVHGLWAQSRKAGSNVKIHPRNCHDTSAIPAEQIQKYICEIPSVKLIQKEWEKHGSCDFSHSAQYLSKTSELFNQLKLPSREELLKLEYTSWKKVKQRIIQLNRSLGLNSEHVFVKFRKNRLQEVRVCYDLRYQFTSCKQQL